MAGLRFSLANSGLITLNTELTKNILAFTPANNVRVLIHEISLSIKDHQSLGGEAEVTVMRQTDVSTTNMASLSPNKNNLSDQETLQTTGYEGVSGASTQSDPTFGDILINKAVPLAGGEFFWIAINRHERIPARGNGTESIGIYIDSPNNCQVTAYMRLEE